MAKKHDENKDLRLLSRICKIDFADKTISASKSAIIGNKSWGRIDFLTHYCGWHFIYNNEVVVKKFVYSTDDAKKKKEKVKLKKLPKDTPSPKKRK